jgi:plasmid stabilization system protein ParE
MTKRLIDAGDSLEDFPHRGRPASSHIRELPTIAPYITRYRVKDDTVFIIGIRHGAQLPD